MKKELNIAILFVFCIILLVQPISVSAKWLTKPNVDLPSNWFIEEEAPYTDYSAWHDPEGAGYVKYAKQEDDGFIYLYYESALDKTYSNEELKAEAITVCQEVREDPIDDSGVMTVAGVPAGYVKIYYEENVVLLGLIIVKDNYYLDVNVVYYAIEAENEAMSLLNSLDVSTAGGTGISMEIIIGAIIAVVVVAVVLFVFFKKRTRTPES